ADGAARMLQRAGAALDRIRHHPGREPVPVRAAEEAALVDALETEAARRRVAEGHGPGLGEVDAVLVDGVADLEAGGRAVERLQRRGHLAALQARGHRQ